MTIKEIFDTQKWCDGDFVDGDFFTCEDHNNSLDMIYNQVIKIVNNMEENCEDVIADMEAEHEIDLQYMRTQLSETTKVKHLPDDTHKAGMRIVELEIALENLMDDYQYNVCYDRHYEKARKVLKEGIIEQV